MPGGRRFFIIQKTSFFFSSQIAKFFNKITNASNLRKIILDSKKAGISLSSSSIPSITTLTNSQKLPKEFANSPIETKIGPKSLAVCSHKRKV